MSPYVFLVVFAVAVGTVCVWNSSPVLTARSRQDVSVCLRLSLWYWGLPRLARYTYVHTSFVLSFACLLQNDEMWTKTSHVSCPCVGPGHLPPFSLFPLVHLLPYLLLFFTFPFLSLVLPIFTALHGMQSRYSDGNSVCLSVCLSIRPSVRLSNACIVTRRKKYLSRFLYHAKDHSV